VLAPADIADPVLREAAKAAINQLLAGLMSDGLSSIPGPQTLKLGPQRLRAP
jgi:hypothetical protein